MKVRKKVVGAIVANIQAYLDEFRVRYEGMFEPQYMRLLQPFADNLPRLALSDPERFSLIHGDFRLDNMLFDAKGGEVPLVVLDWQSIAPDNPGLDVAYFLATSYPIELRSRDEVDLLHVYLEEMWRRGVHNYSFEMLWRDYRRGAWLGLFTAVFASTVAKRTPRGDAMFMRMARGAAVQLLDHQTLALA
jgi:aminoglycoside phosphotransferase (APT) family kinase protein